MPTGSIETAGTCRGAPARVVELTGTFTVNKDSTLLAHAERWLAGLVREADATNGRITFRYTFPFSLHDMPAEAQRVPWFSGMAQGRLLQLAVRLGEITGKAKYRDWADRIFATLVDVAPSPTQVAHVDEQGYYWIDIYPNGGRYDYTLNGFMFGVYGVYEYAQWTGRPEAFRVLDASLTTLRRYVPSFRNPGAISTYCLRHEMRSASYHAIHVLQLHNMYLITGDDFFETASRDFWNDYH